MKQFKITGFSVWLMLLAVIVIIIAVIVVAVKLLILFLPIILILIGAYLIYRFLFVKKDNKQHRFYYFGNNINNSRMHRENKTAKRNKHKTSKKSPSANSKVIDATYREKK